MLGQLQRFSFILILSSVVRAEWAPAESYFRVHSAMNNCGPCQDHKEGNLDAIYALLQKLACNHGYLEFLSPFVVRAKSGEEIQLRSITDDGGETHFANL